MPRISKPSSNTMSAVDQASKNSHRAAPQQLKNRDAFMIFLLPRLLSAIHTPIQDCDEVFNYWEPTHYLTHGYGLQTWEYSPVYAIRSWAYVGLHAVILTLGRLVPFVGNDKTSQFYFLRIVLGVFCAACETKLFSVIARTTSPRIAVMFLVIMASSAGMFHAGTAYLPSTFAMYTTMLGTAAFMDWRGGLRTAQGIFWFGLGALLGWPFAAALIVPFMLEELLLAVMGRDVSELVLKILDGGMRTFLVLALQCSIDSFFYKKLVNVPWNIVAYNVFSQSSKGPNIYGTEPWHYYLRNLVINFNISFPLAICSVPLVLIQQFVRRKPTANQSFLRLTTFCTPFYLWLAIFTLQPHKEERFMYPVYPLLALCSAISIHILLQILGHANQPHKTPTFFSYAKLFLVVLLVLSGAAISTIRSIGIVEAYNAPLKIYTGLQASNLTSANVCLGKEWYRFPSSYHLPNNMRAKFIKSEFKGLLPGPFSEITDSGFGLFPGASLIPSGMNDENKEDPSKYIDIERCDFLVDMKPTHVVGTELEPVFIDDDSWDKVKCERFLDSSTTKLLGRLLWIPDWNLIPKRFRRQWGTYCLLQRRSGNAK